jgi:hypothetical protein
LFALAWFRDTGDIRRLGAGFGLPQSTAYRYLDEVIEVLAARAPGLRDAMECALPRTVVPRPHLGERGFELNPGEDPVRGLVQRCAPDSH